MLLVLDLVKLNGWLLNWLDRLLDSLQDFVWNLAKFNQIGLIAGHVVGSGLGKIRWLVFRISFQITQFTHFI